MPFFRRFASANKTRWIPALLLGVVASLSAGDFEVRPSTVVAGRTLAVTTHALPGLETALARWNGKTVPFFKTKKHTWRALLGVPPLQSAGTQTLTLEGTWSGGGPFLEEIPFTVVDGTYPVSQIKLAPERDALFSTGAVERDAGVLAALYSQTPSPRQIWTGPFVRPSTGVVSSVFGARRTYGDRPAQSAHSGMDIAAPNGTWVLAPQRGSVLYAGRLDSFGYTVLIDHGQGVYTYYLHMQKLFTHPGARVKTGTPLGEMGQEGIATGPHVHWTLVVSGERVDPQEWVETPP